MTDAIEKARYGVHAKSFVFDNKDVVIGTFNFDPRSANLNTEMTIACSDNLELAKSVTDDINGRIGTSINLDSDEAVNQSQFYKVGFFKKLEYFFVLLPSNALDYLL